VRELENTIARLVALAPDEHLTLSLLRSMDAQPRESAAGSGTGAAQDIGPGYPLRTRVEAFEKAIVAAEYEAASKNQSETARRLGVSRPALVEKLHKYGLVERS
jgi:two-component system response regulator AtoC